jgi:hypothetical protein
MKYFEIFRNWQEWGHVPSPFLINKEIGSQTLGRSGHVLQLRVCKAARASICSRFQGKLDAVPLRVTEIDLKLDRYRK